ncbi:MAG TPA: NAD+ synthase [Rhodanobacteraceae bacterium]|nr:NAD+ synthase [Rhodanobacteraceae bacterium]
MDVPTLRFALAQYDFPVGAIAANAARMRELSCHASERGAALIAFPEQSLCGYPAEDLLLRPGFLAACERELSSLANDIDGITAIVGHPHAVGEVYNAASVIADGEILATYHKQALPNYTVFDEKRWFRPGNEPLVFDCEGVRVGLLICEDIWEAEPAAKVTANGAQLLLVINASPYDTQQAATRESLLAQRARENDLPIAYVNVIGGQDDLLFDGASLLVAANGSVIARGPSFEEHLLFVEFDPHTRTLHALDWPARGDGSEEAILYAGLVRGVRDYVHKNGFGDVLLGLSGGIDSALTLAIAVDALGAEHVTAVMLPSRYTSELSLREARAQAQTVRVRYLDLSIESAFEAFVRALEPACGGYEPSDLTQQNLQSRARGVLLMALSNQTGALLLSTGNKSEMAVGYATLYGDMCGAYAPLKDVYKTQVYRLARWRNTAGNREQGTGNSNAQNAEFPIPVAVIERPPSAELRADQTDQDSLPPYNVLDDILSRYIEGAQSQTEIVAAGFDAEIVRHTVRMVLVNEFKRRQSAPGPRVSTCAFGRERRYPITDAWR